ncbi:molybdenum ABC transporter, periplasmic molybdate-binding protein [Methanococcus vannielii SB]|uniref:Molybdenum ABC transporter, periplasmic molybdate-binding protein n=1 Tax=Methanococcus vannielii (strain ATCC 35089 / DSM 1224 / JCM 13029 / OCM 148 / SB) TaxID=406327 RepID=A6USN9_METVS|nr:molybdate ABC transporter substrate-binding protein [Methanococcus vannielii]ABR55511.1 molybdenum ABC transporter, periplasmic molybdate-binding protein [Methanococcus vannielii SB]
MKKQLFGILSLIFLCAIFSGCIGNLSNDKVIHAYVGAGMQGPMDEIGVEFEKKYGIKVEYDYSGSGALLSKIIMSNKGDIFMPGDYSTIYRLQEKEMIKEYSNVTKHIPVIIVQKGNPKNIQGIRDLEKEGLKIAVGEESIAIGAVFPKILEKADKNGNISKNVKSNVVVKGITVKQVLFYVSEKTVDCAIIWRADALTLPESVDIVPIESEYNIIKTVPISILGTTKDYDSSKLFYDYVNNEGKAIFKKHGFMVIE